MGNQGTASQPHIAAFSQVDHTPDAAFFLRFVDDANALEPVRACKQRMLALLQVTAGQQLLDVGCGAGDDARELARLVGGAGRVVGVDSSAEMIAEARRRSQGLNLPVAFCVSDAQWLDFDDDSFDGCRIERVLMHTENPAQLLAEMARVTRSGGRIVAFDFDWDTLIINHPDRSLTRKIVTLMCDSLRQGWIGRRLPMLLREAGLIDLTILPHTIITPYAFLLRVIGGALEAGQTAGLLSASEVAGWLHSLAEYDQAGTGFNALQGFIVAGKKP